VVQMWEMAINAFRSALLEGFAGVQRCNANGRFAMVNDLGVVDNSLRKMAPPSCQVQLQLQVVKDYIQAFHTSWGKDLEHFAIRTWPTYGEAKIVMLIELIATANQIKDREKAALLQRIRPYVSLV
jgi:Protein of unknown function C-terminus (DUF2451)